MKQRIRAVGFDFDGTLIISEEEKAPQMAEVFREKFRIRKGVESAYKKLNGKALSREEKVKALFQQFLKRNPAAGELRSIKSHFGRHYEKSLCTCPLFACTNIIKELKDQVDLVFLLSLEDRKEVLDLTKKCGLAKYFDEILGGPKTKIENLRHLLHKYRLKPAQVMYIGDAHSDVIASRAVNVKAVLVGKKHLYEKLKEDLEADFRFSSLCEIPYDINGLKR